MAKLVSVIVPVYNMEKLLSRCIESILNQTYSDLELILVNDGSKDNSANICEQYKEKDKRVTVLHKTNSGVADATNLGLDNAKGDFILFVDSDDYIVDDMIENLVSHQVRTGADIVQTGMSRVNEHDAVTFVQAFEPKIIGDTYSIIKEFFCGSDILLCLASKLFSAHLFSDYRFESGRNIIDILSMPVLLSGCRSYAITDGAGYMAFFREGSVSRGFLTDRTYDDNKYYLNNWLEFLETNYPEVTEFKGGVYYRGAYEMSYRYPLLSASPHVTDKKNKKKEMYSLFCYYYKNLLDTRFYKTVESKKKIMFRIFYFSPFLFRFVMKLLSFVR